jgi:hypothetical protein
MLNNDKLAKIPDNFFWETYINLNPDLKKHKFDKIKSEQHYIKFGFKENRNYYYTNLPSDFNYKIYIRLNKDLENKFNMIKFNECLLEDKGIALPRIIHLEPYLENNKFKDYYYEKLEAFSKFHYEKFGIKEGRKYKINIPENFDWKTYLSINKELQNICSNKEECINHYKTVGYFENKKYICENLFEKYNFFYTKQKFIEKYDNKIIHSNITYYNSENATSYLHMDYFKNTLFNYSPNSIDDLDILKEFIVIVNFGNLGGGTGFFMNSIISKYKYHQTFLIIEPCEKLIKLSINNDYVYSNNISCDETLLFLNNNVDKIIKIFVNHTLYHNENFLIELLKINKEKIYITHDYYLLNNIPQPYYNEIRDERTGDNSKININMFDTVIMQNINNYHIYKKFLNHDKKIIISPLPDFNNELNYVSAKNSKIVVGIIGTIHAIKGELIVKELIDYINSNHLNMEVVIFGTINMNYSKKFYYKTIDDLNNFLTTYKPNILLDTSIWNETYSYSLTLSMVTQLPILSLEKPFLSVIKDRLNSYNKSFYFNNIFSLVELINSQKQDYFYTINPTIYYNSFWEDFFITTKEKKITKPSNNNNVDLSLYAVYFPQFHSFPENNISFYNDFTDSKNLDVLLNSNNIVNNFETPCVSYYNINEYSLQNKSIIQKQINLLNDYNIDGFAIYYYWFSENTITQKNTIMDKVINHFFDKSINMGEKKVFFVWANEPWTKNPAFNVNNNKIETDYSNNQNYYKLFDNLITYFKSNRYLKINNKPVIYVHQPWHLSDEQLNTCYQILNKSCKKYGFDGIHLIVNSINKKYNNFVNVNHHFNYKTSKTNVFDEKQKCAILDYKKYIENDVHDVEGIQSLVFNFDNRARLVKPNRLKYSTICVNNTQFEQIRMCKKIVDIYSKHKYKNNDNNGNNINNIMLINAWNEWGEKMSIEPSNEYGFYYLNLINSLLKN